jgi:hypothetical protein
MRHERNIHKGVMRRRPCAPDGARPKCTWAYWLGPLVGLASLLWFLVRVLPKPSRATYPCQRVAAPLASGFVIWLMGLAASTLAYRRARALYARARYLLAGLLAGAGVLVLWLAVGATTNSHAGAGLMPDDPPNMPIGTGKGIYPGRVVWVYEPDVTLWDGQTGNWWDDANTDQRLADAMVSLALRALTGERNDATAWNALFRHFNRTHGYGNIGYKTGEKIAIKLNMNQDRDPDSSKSWRQRAGMPSPHVVHALLKQLIQVAGVAGRDITLYDASKYIGDPIYEKVRADPDARFQEVRFVVVPGMAQNGREPASLDVDHLVQFADPSLPNQARAHLPLCVTEARYLINMALLRGHGTYGVTFTAKNHFGSMRFPDYPWGPGPLHNYGSLDVPPGTYSCLVDLIGSAHLGGKTLLYLIDALYPAVDNSGDVIRFQSFGNDWCSSLFASQDPVAIDSVGFDFLRDEPESLYVQRGRGLDNYLHEAALADNPPSGILYDPDGDGVPLQSLGVHEHWNNPVEKQYSRNLGTGLGIELVAVRPTGRGGLMSMARTDLTGDGFIDAYDVATFAQAWLSHRGGPQWSARCDFSGDGQVNFNDLAWLFDGWNSWTPGQELQVD